MTTQSDWDSYARLTPACRYGPPTPFSWSPHPGHGLGVELLGIRRGAQVLELGCGKGNRLAVVASLGARAVGVDISAVQVAAAADRWGPALKVHHADATVFLRSGSSMYDAIYSAFGAHWFTNPHVLLPAIRRRLRPGGLLVLSHLPPGEHFDSNGPAAVPGNRSTVIRWEGEASQWVNALEDHGFLRPSACTLHPPRGVGASQTVVLRGWA